MSQKGHPHAPIRVKTFVLYSLIYCSTPLANLIAPETTSYRLVVGICGKYDSIFYFWALIGVFAFYLSTHVFPDYTIKPASIRRLPIAVSIPLALQATCGFWGIVDHFWISSRVGTGQLSQIYPLIVRVFLPSLWIHFWFSPLCADYLGRVQEHVWGSKRIVPDEPNITRQS